MESLGILGILGIWGFWRVVSAFFIKHCFFNLVESYLLCIEIAIFVQIFRLFVFSLEFAKFKFLMHFDRFLWTNYRKRQPKEFLTNNTAYLPQVTVFCPSKSFKNDQKNSKKKTKSINLLFENLNKPRFQYFFCLRLLLLLSTFNGHTALLRVQLVFRSIKNLQILLSILFF